MDDTMSLDLTVPDNILQPLLVAFDSTTLNEALEHLIDIAKTCDGRKCYISWRISSGCCLESILSPEFVEMARLRSKGTCDPLCMVIYTCSEHDNGRFADLCTVEGLNIVTEIIRTGTTVGFTDYSLKFLLSRICVEEPRFSSIFSKLFSTDASESCDKNMSTVIHFGAEQAYLLSIISEILNERVVEIAVSADLAICIFEILRKAIGGLQL